MIYPADSDLETSSESFPRGKRGQKRRNGLSEAVAQTVTKKDLQAVVKVLIERAKAGNVSAAREVLARALGKPRAITPGSENAAEPEETKYDGEWAAQYIAELNRKRAKLRSETTGSH